MRNLNIALVAVLAVSATAPAFAADRISDSDLLRASRCLGLAKAANLGAVDAKALDAFVKAQRKGRDPGLRDRSDTTEQTARSQGASANGDRKAALLAERDGACKALIENPTGA
ncbi:hypothetical protein [Caulobacter soli]|uniref:hypothetical protein n=1 Tax=Caulobacter soli TaxID=2708539 RepID=UPI0013EA63DE|nr:hypothetical protein [Caulobacter soli]